MQEEAPFLHLSPSLPAVLNSIQARFSLRIRLACWIAIVTIMLSYCNYEFHDR
jgi:hypothetical protein